MLLLAVFCAVYFLSFASGLPPSRDLEFGVARDPSRFPDLYEASVIELQQGLDDCLFTSVDLVKAYFARIEEVNLKGPALRAVLEINPSALEQAAALDKERKLLGKRSPLHGIPILLKDNIATVASEGKANLSEFAAYRGNLPNGWSGIGGQTTNAYFPNADSCGSSSGSGVAASIGLVTVTLGSDTDGSITCPSSYNNAVGIRPTLGLTSRAGVVPISANQDSIGPMTRSVSDAAIVLSVVAGKDPNDNFTVAQPAVVPDYTKALNLNALQGKRIGVPRQVFLQERLIGPGVIDVFEEALETIRELGATVVDPANLPSAQEILVSDNETIVLDTDFKVQLNAYFESLLENPSGVRSLADLIAFNNAHPELEKPVNFTDQSLLIDSERTNGFNATYFQALAFDHDLGRTRGIDAALRDHNLDALILPATGLTWTPPALAGYPIITGAQLPLSFTPPHLTNDFIVPLGFFFDNVTIGRAGPLTVYPAPGVPFGLSFLAGAFSEFELVGYGFAYEQKTKTRIARRAYPAAIPKTQLQDVIGLL
ncbi:hypothetical protein PQX77_016587 [Marasmius sp. AFHP31]|nr:hypothetical protein PQX77_016587 [Marasmius sp. AFHP31]